MERLLLDSFQFQLTIERLCYELIENHDNFENTVVIGLQPRGVHLSRRIVQKLQVLLPQANILHGKLDVTFYRDDFRHRDTPLEPKSTEIEFLIEKKKVILVDDVLYTGRTIRAGLDALLDFGRPSAVELLTLVDRRFTRHLPIQADYVGKTVDAISSERVSVEWEELDGTDGIRIINIDKGI